VTERLPLFPLGTVLFPGLMLPLHIFEERYRLLVKELLDLPADAPRRFGVIAIREGREVGHDGVRALYDVGCTAELRQVEAYEDGRFDIVTTGSTRFRLLGLDDSLPYFQGDVDILDERPGDDADLLAATTSRLFGRYREILLGAIPRGSQDAGDAELPSEPAVLSYLVAAAMVLDLPDKQALLEAEDVAERLRREITLVRRETAILQRIPSLPGVELMRSGYAAN
jgi:Lon protease-like protein